jgi:hypothetical protein
MLVPLGVTEEVAAPDDDDRVRCRSCSSVVAQATDAVERGGSHELTFRNPAGYSWAIRCFRDAEGCASSGALTAEATWFAGYEWCFATCSSCGRHLGWWYVGASGSFVGLITTRIT